MSKTKDHPICQLCGQCLDVCPVFLATGKEELSPRAKQHMLRALREQPGTLDTAPARQLADRCLSCGRCAKACPRNLSVPEVLAALRAEHPNWQQWVWQRWIEHGRLLWPALAQVARLVPAALPPEGLQHMLRSAQSMLDAPANAPWLAASHAHKPGQGQRVLLFAGCTARRIRPRWLHTALTLLQGLGYAPDSPEAFSCCGATLEHAGIPAGAAEARARNMAVWRTAGKPLLVTFCATCHHGLASYPDDDGLGWEQGEQAQWRNALRPLSSLFTSEMFTVTDAAPARIAYHQPCHWQGKDPDLAFLRTALGARLVPPSGRKCCGMGGVLQLADAALSQTVATDCWEALWPTAQRTPAPVAASATGQDVPAGTAVPAATPTVTALTGCSGCTLQLAATAPAGASVRHWLDVVQA